jgi:hypothetical protein
MINGVVVRLFSKVVNMVICSVNMKNGGTEAGLRQECDKKEES